MPEEVTRGGWGGRAAAYDDAAHVARPDALAWDLRALGSVADLCVFDLGCGTGVFSEALANDGARVHCFDGSREMLDRCRVRMESRWRGSQMDLSREVPTGGNLAVARYVLRHMADPARAIALWSTSAPRLAVIEGVPPIEDTLHPATDLYRAAMDAKHGAPKAAIHGSHIVGWMLRAGAADVTIWQRSFPGNSIREWCESGGCDRRQTETVLDFHRNAGDAAKRAYQMEITADDVLVAYRRVVVVGDFTGAR